MVGLGVPSRGPSDCPLKTILSQRESACRVVVGFATGTQTLCVPVKKVQEGPESSPYQRVLGGSWVVISRVISPLIWAITIVTLLITPLLTSHEPPSTKGVAGG